MEDNASLPCAHRLKTSSLTVVPQRRVLMFLRSSSSLAATFSAIIYRMCTMYGRLKRAVYTNFIW